MKISEAIHQLVELLTEEGDIDLVHIETVGDGFLIMDNYTFESVTMPGCKGCGTPDLPVVTFMDPTEYIETDFDERHLRLVHSADEAPNLKVVPPVEPSPSLEDSVCWTCAETRGWKGRGHDVGVWNGVCSLCGEMGPCTAIRDWIRK
jgi:hypothetical protein